jgi:hypothetical protein
MRLLTLGRYFCRLSPGRLADIGCDISGLGLARFDVTLVMKVELKRGHTSKDRRV